MLMRVAVGIHGEDIEKAIEVRRWWRRCPPPSGVAGYIVLGCRLDKRGLEEANLTSLVV